MIHAIKHGKTTSAQLLVFNELQKKMPRVPKFLNYQFNASYWIDIATERKIVSFEELERYCAGLKAPTTLTYFPQLYYLDIYIPSARLCVEIDGITHKEERDMHRDAVLAYHNIKTLRIKNSDARNKKALAKFVNKIYAMTPIRGFE